ncbi:MAG: N-acetyl-gamma-glutamyl-phosphate reductase [Candidatus Dormibacteria bacterium]
MVPVSRPRVAVAGCTGYIGMQCTALLAAHPGLELAGLAGRSAAGRRHRDAVPGSTVDLVVSETVDAASVDVVVAALPHTVAAAQAPAWLEAGAIVVDLSADFRLRDAAAYEAWYGFTHPSPALTAGAVYGLVEWNRAALRTAQLIAVPGCYPTAALLGTLPLLRDGVIAPRLVVDAKSGVSGAGRSPSLTAHFAEVNESVRAYSVDGHRHSAEIAAEMDAAAGSRVALTFVPHLVPMTRGILATIYASPAPGREAADAADSLRQWCESEAFLRWDDVPPSTKSVAHSNTAAIACTTQGDVAVVTVAIDNLLKGAAGQAVQALNVRLGLDESSGLSRSSPWP